MPKFSTKGAYLRHQDLSEHEDTLFTIESFQEEALGQGTQKQTKWVVYFTETDQGLALNKTNGNAIAMACGSDEMNDWLGHRIALYVKPDVEFQGEIVSAIRVRATKPKGQSILVTGLKADLLKAESRADAKVLYMQFVGVEGLTDDELADAGRAYNERCKAF